MSIGTLLSLMLGLLVLPAALYLALLAALGRRARPNLFARPTLKFAVVIPAHDEQANIAATVQSVRAVDYPAELRHVIVVADNCSDRTAAVAREAGAAVMIREDPEHRGKGHALAFAFERVLAATDVDAVVVVDADTLVSTNLLNAFAARLLTGAQTVQAEYRVRNVETSWRTRLMAVALAMFHRTRSLARSRLGLSVGLRGNGMCFSRQILRACPYRAFGLAEDLEYGLHLGLAGFPVAYAAEAEVAGEMASGGAAAANQRRRWEHGRLQLARTLLPRLVVQALRRRSGRLVDLAMDLAVPPLSYLALAIALGLAFEIARWWAGGSPGPGLVPWAVAALAVTAYVARGLTHSGLGWRSLMALSYAPFYIVWKLAVVGARRPAAWVRTAREAQK